MSPAQRAAEIYREAGVRRFEEDLAAHLARGYVWASPAEFIMARAVKRERRWRWEDLGYAEPLEEADTWLVWMAVGEGRLKRFFELAPRWLEWVAWHRVGDRMRIWHAATVLGKLK